MMNSSSGHPFGISVFLVIDRMFWNFPIRSTAHTPTVKGAINVGIRKPSSKLPVYL